MLRHEEYEFVCTACKVKVITEVEYNEEYADVVDVRCPICKGNVGEVKADNGYGILGTKRLDS